MISSSDFRRPLSTHTRAHTQTRPLCPVPTLSRASPRVTLPLFPLAVSTPRVHHVPCAPPSAPCPIVIALERVHVSPALSSCSAPPQTATQPSASGVMAPASFPREIVYAQRTSVIVAPTLRLGRRARQPHAQFLRAPQWPPRYTSTRAHESPRALGDAYIRC